MADYTQLTPDEVKTILTRYDLDPPSEIKLMQGGQANSSFRITCGSNVYILSVCDEKNPAEVETLVTVLRHLNQNDFPTSIPLLTTDDHPYLMHHNKPVYVKGYMTGTVIESLSCGMLYEVGTMMARLHSITPPATAPDTLSSGEESFGIVIEQGMDHPYIPWLKEKKEYLDAHLDRSSTKGLIHADIYWDNLLFENDRLKALLDFEEAAHYYLLYDIAMTCVGCCSKNGRFEAENIKALIRGYQSVRPLSATEQKQFRAFAVYAGTAGSLWRFIQYNINYPGHTKADTYKELASLADEAMGFDWEKITAV